MVIEYLSKKENKVKYFNILQETRNPVVVIDYTSYLIAQEIPDQVLHEIYASATSLKLTLVIDSLGEAPRKSDISFVDSLSKQYPGLEIIHLTSGFDRSSERYTVITDTSIFFWPMEFQWIDNFSEKVSHHFIALARIPRPHRIRFINELLNKGLDQWGYFSIGCGQGFSLEYNYAADKRLGIDKHNLKHFPTVLDGPVDLTTNLQYKIDDPRITEALVNVVLETSYEKMTNSFFDDLSSWRVPFITEKTVKSFALGQIPMILGPLEQVKVTRDLGFDLFDDLIDHGYDLVVDPKRRISVFLGNLEKFVNKYPKETLQNIKEKLRPRFQYNQRLAKQHFSTNYQIIGQRLKQAIDGGS